MNPVLSIPRSCPSAAGARPLGLTRRLLLWLLVAAGAPGVWTLQLQAQEDNFNDNLDNGWSRYNPIGVASFSLLNGAYRIRTAPSPDATIFGPGRAGSLLLGTNYGDFFYVSVDLVNWDDTLRQSVGLLARIGSPGAGQTTGYAFTWDRGNASATSGDVDISRIDGEVPTGVANERERPGSSPTRESISPGIHRERPGAGGTRLSTARHDHAPGDADRVGCDVHLRPGRLGDIRQHRHRLHRRHVRQFPGHRCRATPDPSGAALP